MSFGCNPCYGQCPPSTVTIQPPPFVVSIPGPALYCPDQPLCIEQCNPCVPNVLPCQGQVGYTSIAQGASSGLSVASIYSQRSQSRFQGDCRSCQ